MRLEDMKYFVEIVKARSINGASKALYVAQPALSRSITALEKELGFPLLKRSKQGITPTKEGLTVYADCVKILQLYTDCNRKWQNIAYETSDTCTAVQIVALPMICNSTMNQVFFQIAQNYSRIHLTLFEKQLHEVLQTAVAQPNTLALSHYNEQTKGDIYAFAKAHHMQIIPLFDDEYKIFTSSDSPLVGRELTQSDLKDCIMATYSNPELESREEFIAAGLSGWDYIFKQRLHLSNYHAMMETAVTTQSLMITANLMTQDNPYRKNGSLVALNVKNLDLPVMTYFLMVNAEPSTEERIVADVICTAYSALAKNKA